MRARSERIFRQIQDSPDVVVLMNGGGHLLDPTFQYVSGVTRGAYEGCSAVLRPGKRPTLVVSRLEEESARTAPDSDIESFATRADQHAVLQRILGKPSRIGVNAPAILLDRARKLEELFPDAELVDVGPGIQAARIVKDSSEVDRVRRACRLASEVAEAIPGMLREGMTEIQLAADIAAAVQRGGGKVAFDTIVCFGKNGSEPHYAPGDVAPRKGDLILVDFGAQLQDYCSDITRMFMYGSATPELRAMFEVVRSAQGEAVDMMRAGVAGRAVDARAREIIDASDYQGRFIHSTGHSIGLEVHDGPGLGPTSEITLQPGMIMTVEPGVYVPGLGGVRIEDTVLVTENGPSVLTPVTRDLVEVSA